MFRNDGTVEVEAVESVYERVLGDAFAQLDPQLRMYFGSIPPGFEGIGVGCFREAGLRMPMLHPLFAVLGIRGIAFPERGAEVPFTIRNVAAAGGARRAARTFHFPSRDRVMTDSIDVVDGRLVDRLGTGGRVEVTLEAHIVEGGMRMTSRRLAVRACGIRFRLPPIVRVNLNEEAVGDEGRSQCVTVSVRALGLGEIYGYTGTFTYELRPIAEHPTG
jgi:hypothetical protein